MKVDKKTGEILSFYSINSKYRAPELLEDCKDKPEVLNLFRKGEHNHKLLWTNYASNTLLETSLSKDQIRKFQRFCEMILVRNIMFENTRDVAEYLNVSYKNVSKLLGLFEDNGLIRYFKRNVMKQGTHIILVNPTIVWRSYLHSKGIDWDTRKPFSHNSSFSKAHKDAIKGWVDETIKRSISSTETNKIDHNELARKLGYINKNELYHNIDRILEDMKFNDYSSKIDP